MMPTLPSYIYIAGYVGYGVLCLFLEYAMSYFPSLFFALLASH